LFAYDSVTADVVDCPEDIVFVVDASGSISKSDFELMKSFLSHLVSRLDVNHGGTRVGFISYSTSVYTISKLDDHSSVKSLQTAINELTIPYGRTHTHLALAHVRWNLFQSVVGDRSNVPNVVVVLTDGISMYKQATLVSINYHLHTYTMDECDVLVYIYSIHVEIIMTSIDGRFANFCITSLGLCVFTELQRVNEYQVMHYAACLLWQAEFVFIHNCRYQ